MFWSVLPQIFRDLDDGAALATLFVADFSPLVYVISGQKAGIPLFRPLHHGCGLKQAAVSAPIYAKTADIASYKP